MWAFFQLKPAIMIQFSKNAENIRGRHKLFQVRCVYLRLPGAPFVVEHKDKRGGGNQGKDNECFIRKGNSGKNHLQPKSFVLAQMLLRRVTDHKYPSEVQEESRFRVVFGFSCRSHGGVSTGRRTCGQSPSGHRFREGAPAYQAQSVWCLVWVSPLLV